MDESGRHWIPPANPGEEEWVWDSFATAGVGFPTKLGHWVRVCASGALEEFHWDADHTSGKPNRWAFKDCDGNLWDRPFDKHAYGNEWTDARWWQPSSRDAAEVGLRGAKEYLTYCTKAAPFLARLVAETVDLEVGSAEVTVPYVLEDDGGWNTDGFAQRDEDHRETLVPLMEGLLRNRLSCAVLMGASLPAEIAKRQRDEGGILQAFHRYSPSRGERYWALAGSEADAELIRHAVRFVSALVFDMGVVLDVALDGLVHKLESPDLPNFVAEHVTAFFVHGPSYNGHLVWRKT